MGETTTPKQEFFCAHDVAKELGRRGSPQAIRSWARQHGFPPDLTTTFLPLFPRQCGYSCFVGWSKARLVSLVEYSLNLAKIVEERREQRWQRGLEKQRAKQKERKEREARRLKSNRKSAIRRSELKAARLEQRIAERLSKDESRERLCTAIAASRDIKLRGKATIAVNKFGKRGGRLSLSLRYLERIGAKVGDRIVVTVSPDRESLVITKFCPENGQSDEAQTKGQGGPLER